VLKEEPEDINNYDEEFVLTDDELKYGAPSLASQMPYNFKNGTIFTEIDCNCSKCGIKIFSDHIFGLLSEIVNQQDQHTEGVEVYGDAVCGKCNTFTRIAAYFTEDGVLEFELPESLNSIDTDKKDRIPLNENHRKLLSKPTIISQFPIKFKNNNVLNEWEGSCASCKKTIPPEHLHGNICYPIDTLVTIEAVGVCLECELLTMFSCRVRDNLSLEWVNSEGRWCKCDTDGSRLLGQEGAKRRKTLKEMLISMTKIWK
jgi:hypothetical protein